MTTVTSPQASFGVGSRRPRPGSVWATETPTSRRSRRHEDSEHGSLDRNGPQANGTDGAAVKTFVAAVAGNMTGA
jgi:hypothetical protein